MGTAMVYGNYPEDCDSSGSECLQCVRRTAEAVRALTASPTAEWAAGVFHKMYTHAACRQMEHSFLWACGTAAPAPMAPMAATPALVQIATAAA